MNIEMDPQLGVLETFRDFLPGVTRRPCVSHGIRRKVIMHQDPLKGRIISDLFNVPRPPQGVDQGVLHPLYESLLGGVQYGHPNSEV